MERLCRLLHALVLIFSPFGIFFCFLVRGFGGRWTLFRPVSEGLVLSPARFGLRGGPIQPQVAHCEVFLLLRLLPGLPRILLDFGFLELKRVANPPSVRIRDSLVPRARSYVVFFAFWGLEADFSEIRLFGQIRRFWRPGGSVVIHQEALGADGARGALE